MSDTTEPVQLGVQDLSNALRIIDFASEQGAFKGWNTIRDVMNVRDRLESFLNAYQETEKAANETPLIPETTASPAVNQSSDLPPEYPA